MKSTQARLAAYPVAEPLDSDFELVSTELPKVGEGQVLLRTIYLSLDPYMRGRMSTAESYAAPLEIGDVVLGGTVCEVVESRAASRTVGDLVLAFTGWQTHAVVDARHTRRLDPQAAPISTALGVLGMPGFTAYAGLLELGRPQAGETVVVAAAAGPVGSAVGQIARIKGARAVGIAGGPKKCRVLLEELGFDAAVDHRSPTFVEELAAATPDGIDVYFENVGGPVFEAVVPRLNRLARIPVCGLITRYNDMVRSLSFEKRCGASNGCVDASISARSGRRSRAPASCRGCCLAGVHGTPRAPSPGLRRRPRGSAPSRRGPRRPSPAGRPRGGSVRTRPG